MKEKNKGKHTQAAALPTKSRFFCLHMRENGLEANGKEPRGNLHKANKKKLRKKRTLTQRQKINSCKSMPKNVNINRCGGST